MKSVLLGVLFVTVIVCVHAAIDADLITSLPGFGAPPTKQYSGLVAVDDAKTAFLHYWFVTASTNSATAPVVVWLNGGPGCSSVEGYLLENGPLHFSGEHDANGLPLLIVNPYSWANIANMLYIESPAGVGFSYNVNGSTRASDDLTSANNYGFLLNWFKGFPEFAANPFFITGESYAGMYVPTFADRILVGNAAGNPKVNLQGFAVGNAVNGADFDTKVQLYWGLALFSENTADAILANCGGTFAAPPRNASRACTTARSQATTEAGSILNIYNIYDNCPSLVGEMRVRDPELEAAMAKRGVIQAPDQCIQANAQGRVWLDTPAVRTALHVDSVRLQTWSVCSNLQYSEDHGSLLPQYPGWAKQLRILVYSGDTDACVPHVFTEQWTEGLGFAVTQAWRPWLFGNQVGGYVVSYENNFTFLTVKGSGHMVPQYTPQAAFTMFQKWLLNQQF